MRMFIECNGCVIKVVVVSWHVCKWLVIFNSEWLQSLTVKQIPAACREKSLCCIIPKHQRLLPVVCSQTLFKRWRCKVCILTVRPKPPQLAQSSHHEEAAARCRSHCGSLHSSFSQSDARHPAGFFRSLPKTHNSSWGSKQHATYKWRELLRGAYSILLHRQCHQRCFLLAVQWWDTGPEFKLSLT